MGDLVVMPARKATAGEATSADAAGRTAAILFFTGVRYYRMDEAAAPKRRRRARTRVPVAPPPGLQA